MSPENAGICGSNTRRQHYVWRKYLKAWATDEKIYCLREGKIFRSNLMGVAQRRDFYQLQELDDDDIYWINKLIIEKSPPLLKQLHLQLLEDFKKPFELIRFVRSQNLSNPEIEDQCKIIINNADEKFHGAIEAAAIPFIEDLLQGKTAFFDDTDKKMSFIYFLTTQYLRTNKMKSGLENALGLNELTHDVRVGPDKKYLRPSKIWGITSHMFATNFGQGILARNYRMILIKNECSLPFVTSL